MFHNFQKFPKISKKGFTMIEFSLACAFISLLLITIAIISSNIITIYQKGLTLKSVNSVGRGLIDEFTSGINSAPAVDTVSLCNGHLTDNISTCKNANAHKFIFQQKLGTRTSTTLASGDEGAGVQVQMAGILCTGNYSYLWNTYYGIKEGKTIKLKYKDLSGADVTYPTGSEPFRLIRVQDPNYRVCSSAVNKKYQSILEDASVSPAPASTADVIDITQMTNGRANKIAAPESGFLSGFDLELDLYELAIFPISQDSVTLRTFMSGTFILATDRGNVNISRSADYCDIKNLMNDDTAQDLMDIGSEFNYCAINRFNFAARTAGM